MTNVRRVPPRKMKPVKTYLFPVELSEESDGRWSAVCPALTGCATYGRTREQALQNIREAVAAYVEDMIEAGESMPIGVKKIDRAAVSVTV